MNIPVNRRRNFIRNMLGACGLVAIPYADNASPMSEIDNGSLPSYARKQFQSTLNESGNFGIDGVHTGSISAGKTYEVLDVAGSGAITHISFILSDEGLNHLKEVVLRAYWDDSECPSIEVPIGDFFGLNLGRYAAYESAYMSCSPCNVMNCNFVMPFRKRARFTITNEGSDDLTNFFSGIDHKALKNLPPDMMYFHARYRQSLNSNFGSRDGRIGDEADTYMLTQIEGKGHSIGNTIGVVRHTDNEITNCSEQFYVDGKSKLGMMRSRLGGSLKAADLMSNYIGPSAFAYKNYGIPLIISSDGNSQRYCYYSWYIKNAVVFNRDFKHVLKYQNREDIDESICSVSYWFQNKPKVDIEPLAPVSRRIQIV